ncbi:MAG: polysaccharide deacetylase family protein [Bryobacterales bacterium]|jgi:peptidoglycan/xylan/chitin deacetylase (PgdA/CDA1 family)|nr:polysaccharide deacetylase family protein [Bryobacterales bacterium]
MPLSRRSLLAAAVGAKALAQPGPFHWPSGKRGAVSFTFDDARVSQIDFGIPVLNHLGLKATFYVSPSGFRQRVWGWKQAIAAGHEMGHHSHSHPCTVNYRFSRDNALEDYTLGRMEADLDRATAEIEETFGVRPVSFAYPCGQTWVGRGEERRSYVPLIARRFRTGRGYLNEAANDPQRCDLAYLMGTHCDGYRGDQLVAQVEAAMKEGRWLVFAGHDFGDPAPQTTSIEAIRAVWTYASDPAQGIWLDTVATISDHLAKTRSVAAQR